MAIKINSVDVWIKNNSILEDINININSGELVILIGPNGCGKTTLLRAILNIIDHQSGSIKVSGKNIVKTKRKTLSREISYLPQIKQTLPPIKVKKFLLFSRFPYLGFLSSYKREDIEKVNEISSEFKIESLLDRQISTLSGGELQRVLIASAVVQQTDIIFLDEPTTFLDPNHRWEIFNLIEKINRKENKTIVLVTHFLEYVLNFGQKIIALKDGKVYFSGNVKKLHDNKVLNELYNFDLNIFKHGENYLIDFPKKDRNVT